MIDTTSLSSTGVSSRPVYRMSSSLRYTLTNLCRSPESVTSWPLRPGYLATRPSKSSPTVEPSTVTEGAPPACERRMVGKRTSTGIRSDLHQPEYRKNLTIQSAFKNDRGLLNLPIGDPERPQDGVAVFQADDDVEPRRLHRLAHVGRRGPGLGVGVGVEDAHQFEAEGLGGPDAPDEIAGVDRVGARRGVCIGRRVDDLDAPVGHERAWLDPPGEQTARLVGKTVVAVPDDLEVLAAGQPQGRIPEASDDRQEPVPLRRICFRGGR